MKERKPLRLFSCGHEGKYIFGLSVVIANNKKAALKLLKAKLTEMKMPTDENEISCEEIDLTIPSVHVLFDGVY
jgi:hypothetical protein